MNSESKTTSRRSALKVGIAVIAGTSVVALAPRASAQSAQAAPASVAYQTKPNNGAQCSGCVQFVAPNACKIVSGVIAADGWCELYSPKS
jgi:hypothetical protein